MTGELIGGTVLSTCMMMDEVLIQVCMIAKYLGCIQCDGKQGLIQVSMIAKPSNFL
jgi:hypothetical protein